MMIRAVRPSGFTLVEVLVALALVGIVTLLMLEGMRFAALGLDRVAATTARLEARQSLEALLAHELGAAILPPLAPGAAGFVGAADRLRFLTLAEDGEAGLYRVDLATVPAGTARALVLTRRRLDGIASLNTARDVLVPRLARFRIAYFGRTTPTDKPRWHRRWQGVLPRLVRLEIDDGDAAARPPLVVRLWAAQ